MDKSILIDAPNAEILLRNAQAELHRLGGAQAITLAIQNDSAFWTRHLDWLAALEVKLVTHEPFRTIANSWIMSTIGGGRTGRDVSSHWVWKQLQAGLDPQDIVASATASVAMNQIEAWDIRPVKGITVNEPHDLPNGAALVPNNTLPRNSAHAAAFAHPAFGPEYPGSAAALVQPFNIKPALYPNDQEACYDSFNKYQSFRNDYAKIMRFALGLSSGGPVEMTHSYAISNESCIIASAASIGYYSSISNGYIPFDREVNLEDAILIFDMIKKLKSPKAFELSADRLLRSRLIRSIEDQIIDLGMAAEIALMHEQSGSGDGKTEITNKISTRGAWLVGNEFQERTEIYKNLRKLYHERSKIVHTGIASISSREMVTEFDSLVANILRAILNRGCFPNWNALVLGFDHLPDAERI